MSDNRDSLTAQAVHTFEPVQNERTGRWYSLCTCDWRMSGVTWLTEQAARDYVQAKHIDREGNRDSAARADDEAAEIAVRAAETLNEIVRLFGPDAVDWIRDELIRSAVRSFTDRNGDTWIEGLDGLLCMVDAPAATFHGWDSGAVERVYGPLAQLSGAPLPLVHATSRWQRVLGRLGIRTRAWCGKWIVAGRLVGASRECRECRRAVDGER